MINYAEYFANLTGDDLTRQATILSGKLYADALQSTYTDYFNNPQAGMTQIPAFPYLDVNSYYDAYLNALQQSVEPIPAITPTPTITPTPPVISDQVDPTHIAVRSDPEIQDVINDQLLADIGETPGLTNPARPEVRRRRGRRSTILTSQQGLKDTSPITRPSARLLG